MCKCKLFSTILVMLFMITSCATTPSVPTMDDLIAKGGEVVNIPELIGTTGITFVGTDGGWSNYFGVDGRKVVKINKTGLIKELTWRVNDSGEFCQQMFSTEKEACDNVFIIRDKDGIYNSYEKENNKPGFPFTAISGNPENF